MELLDENQAFMQSLTTPDISERNSPRGWLADDPTAQRHEVFIPSNLRCEGCTVQNILGMSKCLDFELNFRSAC